LYVYQRVVGVGSVQHPFLGLLGGGPRAGDLTWGSYAKRMSYAARVCSNMAGKSPNEMEIPMLKYVTLW